MGETASTWAARLDGVSVVHRGRPVLNGLDLVVPTRAKIGVVGPNGGGKSTVLRLLAGRQTPTRGRALRAPSIEIGVLEQEPRLDEDATVLSNVLAAVADTLRLLARFERISEHLASTADEATLRELGDVQDELERRGAWDLESRMHQALDALGCPPPLTPVRHLSGGERRRVALCRVSFADTDLLLLDEPTNHLDTEGIQWLEHHLASFPGALVVVSHDRYFLDAIAEQIWDVERGQVTPYDGNYSRFLEVKATRLTVEGRHDARRRHRLQEELTWLRSAGRARQIRNRARLTRYEELLKAAERPQQQAPSDVIRIPPGPRLGNLIVEAEHLTKAFGGDIVIDDLNFCLPRNGIVGVLGPNGVGKTTLLEIIAGRQQPDSGALRVGESVRISYVDQARAGLDPDRPAWQLIANDQEWLTLGAQDVPARSYLASFGIRGADQQKPVRQFSGGERARLNLALALAGGGNLILLDEPTNDLDLPTIAGLESALIEFPGCAVIATHDRWFLDRVVTHLLAWDGDPGRPGHWVWFEGTFASYQAQASSPPDRPPGSR
jgi:ATP-binding cassette ChvD family protein